MDFKARCSREGGLLLYISQICDCVRNCKFYRIAAIILQIDGAYCKVSFQGARHRNDCISAIIFVSFFSYRKISIGTNTTTGRVRFTVLMINNSIRNVPWQRNVITSLCFGDATLLCRINIDASYSNILINSSNSNSSSKNSARLHRRAGT